MNNGRLFLMKISLEAIEPEIWRRFVVPADIPLDRLHDVIQIIMGWTDSHLHEFIIGQQRYTENFPECEEEEGIEEGQSRLVDLIKRKGAIFQYHYDFGDSRMHQLTVEDSNYRDSELSAPLFCLEGERACPPEDVGGVPGYYEFCEAVSDKKHSQHRELTDWSAGFAWYDRVFKSEEYNIGKINYELMTYLRWSRQRLLPRQVEGFE